MRQQRVRRRAGRRASEPAAQEQLPPPRAPARGVDRTGRVLAAIDAVLAEV